MGFNILIVDDSAITRAMMIKSMRMADIPISEMYEACDGQQALEVLENNWIDLVFTDINMPVMTGIELIEHMSQDGLLQTIPVILVSIEGSATRIDNLKAKGISAFIRKPFTPEQVREVTDRVMSVKMQSDFDPQIGDTLEKVFEQFAFMFTENISRDEIAGNDDGSYVQATMRFTGPISGQMLIAIPQALCNELAANVMGVEESDLTSGDEGLDATKELINLLCGQVLTAICGDEPMFDLSVPQSTEIDAAAWAALRDAPGTKLFTADDTPVLLQFNVEVHT